MAWILIEGLDRSGKSSVAEDYKKQGYKVVHMSAPDKKYFKDDYSGESYFEEIVRMYSEYDGQDVVFDRTIYGELIWPNVYGRISLLTEEDIEYLGHMERNNETSKILMYDSNTEAHWQRCADNKEPLNRQQFGRANIFYERLVNDYGFQKKQLSDFPELMPEGSGSVDSNGTNPVGEEQRDLLKHDGDTDNSEANKQTPGVGDSVAPCSDEGDNDAVGSIEDKLERANAIRTLLQGKIVKKKGGVYDDLEQSIRGFLNEELDQIFTGKSRDQGFTPEETNILKLYVQRIKEKQKAQ